MANIHDLDVMEARILRWEGERYIICDHNETPPQIYDESEKHNPIDYTEYSIWFQVYK